MEQEHILQASQALVNNLENAQLNLLRNAHKIQSPSDSMSGDLEDIENRDPAIVKEEVENQTSYLRKLKFQYIEQNAKDRYVKSIVSDIDDAPIVSEEDNRVLRNKNASKKEELRISKATLAEMQDNVRQLAPLVEDDYVKAKQAAEKAMDLAKKIIDARLAISRLRQIHPHPRLTVQSADKKLADQIEEMQVLTDDLQATQSEVSALKKQVKEGSLKVEGLRARRAEVEREVQLSGTESTDDGRLVPLYDWFTASLSLHRYMTNLDDSHAESGNELLLKYSIPHPMSKKPHPISIALIFQPNSHQLVDVNVAGLEDIGVDIGSVIDLHISQNDVHGLVASILARAREGS